jgi:lipid II:glycine glycyltransferase (peptidoglycan interpeptide bridge formation enzyme)
MAADYICSLSVDEENPSWDNFVAGLPGGHHEQTIPWAKIRKLNGWDSMRIIIEKNGKIIAGAQLLLCRISFFGKIGYISYGPCVAEKSAEVAEKLLQEILRITKDEKINYLTISLPYFGDYLIPLLRAGKFRPIIDGLPPPSLMTSTLLIDLKKSSHEILAGMKAKTRYNINYGIRKGIEIREGTREDIDIFFTLMIATCARRKSNPSHPNKRFFELLWDNFYNKGWVRIHIAEFNKEPVCAMLSFSFGDTFRVWKFGWSGYLSNLFPNNVLYWKLIELSKLEGFRRFDFVSVDTAVSKAFQNGHAITQSLEAKYFYGPTVFKMGFGGEVMHLPGAYCYFPNPIMRMSYNILGHLLLRQKWIMNLLALMWDKRKSSRKA